MKHLLKTAFLAGAIALSGPPAKAAPPPAAPAYVTFGLNFYVDSVEALLVILGVFLIVHAVGSGSRHASVMPLPPDDELLSAARRGPGTPQFGLDLRMPPPTRWQWDVGERGFVQLATVGLDPSVARPRAIALVFPGAAVGAGIRF